MSTYDDMDFYCDLAKWSRSKEGKSVNAQRMQQLQQYSVVADDNLCHIGVGPSDDEFFGGTHVTIVLPHVRGITQLFEADYTQEGYVFYVKTHNSEKSIPVYSGGFFDCDVDVLKATLAQVRHEFLAVLNAYYHRPYCGEQLKLI